MPEQTKIEELTDSLKRYVNTSYELIRLQATERSSVIGSGLISGIILGLTALLSVFFISLWAGFYLSDKIGNNYAGFAIVGGFYFLLGLILLIGRKKLVETPIRDKIIRKLLNKN